MALDSKRQVGSFQMTGMWRQISLGEVMALPVVYLIGTALVWGLANLAFLLLGPDFSYKLILGSVEWRPASGLLLPTVIALVDLPILVVLSLIVFAISSIPLRAAWRMSFCLAICYPLAQWQIWHYVYLILALIPLTACLLGGALSRRFGKSERIWPSGRPQLVLAALFVFICLIAVEGAMNFGPFRIPFF